MGDIDELIREEKVQHLLDECEKAMRLAKQLDGGDRKAVESALEGLFFDLGRTVYNLYWEEDLSTGEEGADLAEITSEVPTEQVEMEPRPIDPPPAFLGGPPVNVGSYEDSEPHTAESPKMDPAENTELPGETTDPSGGLGDKDDDTGWYTSEVEVPDRPMFGPEDGLEEDIPESDPIPESD